MHPEDHNPFFMMSLVSALAAEGRAEEALHWAYIGALRLHADLALFAPAAQPRDLSTFYPEAWRTDRSPIGRANVPIPPTTRVRLFEQAVRDEERLPRHYSPQTYALLELAVPAYWPPNTEISPARTKARNETRILLDAEITRDREIASADEAIAHGRIPDGAFGFVPEDWRNRAQPLLSVRIPGTCRANDRRSHRLMTTPPSIGRAAFIIGCSGHFLWMDAENGQIFADAALPTGNASNGLASRRARVVARNGQAEIMLQREQERFGSLILISASGEITDLHPPYREGLIENSLGPQSVSRSGRYVGLGPDYGANAVLDLNANAFVWPIQSTGPRRPAPALSFVEEDRGQLLAIFIRGERCLVRTDRRCAGATLVSTDLRTHQERSLELPAIQPNTRALSYGAGRAWITLAPPEDSSPQPSITTYPDAEAWRTAQAAAQEARRRAILLSPNTAIVDLHAMQIVWTGQGAEAPSPQGEGKCGVDLRFVGRNGPDDLQSLVVSADGGSFQLSGDVEDVTCAATADATRLLIISPPFMHLYRLAGS